MFHWKQLVRLEPTYVLFQLINTHTVQSIHCQSCNHFCTVWRGAPLCLDLVKTRTRVCKTTPKYNVRQNYMVCMINAQNNHILELLKLVIVFLKKNWQKLFTTQTAVDLIATQCDCPDSIIVYYEGLLDITHFSIEYKTFITLTSEKYVSLV
jgi:hypothetical protein